MPLTTVVAAPVTHAARPSSMNGAARPPVYGDKMYMAAGGAYSQTSGASGSSRMIVLSNVDGSAVQRSGSYAYNAAPAPLPPTLVIEGSAQASERATLTYSRVPPRTQPAPGPAIRFYASNQAVAQNGMKCKISCSERSIALRHCCP